jgi:predicted transcriptional regulator
MRIYDILNSGLPKEDRITERRDKDKKDERKATSDHAKISTEAQQLYQTQRDQKLSDVRVRIDSGYYQRREVLEKVADAIYRVLNR